MKNLSIKVLFLIFVSFFLINNAQAAEKPAGNMIAEATDNQWYSLKAPADWQLIVMPTQPEIKSLSVLVVNQKLKSGVSITTFDNPLTARQLAETTIANMVKDSIKIGELAEKDKLLFTTFTRGNEKGEIYFGANGKDCAVISIYGNSLDAGKEILKLLKAKSDSSIFPQF